MCTLMRNWVSHLQLLHLNIAQAECLNLFQYDKYKKQTSLHSALVPAGLDFLVAMGTATVAMKIFLSKNEEISAYKWY